MLWIIVLILLIVISIPITWWISTINSIKRKDIKVSESLSGIEIALAKRYDTLTKMLDITKGYKDHEREVLLETIKLRRGMSVSDLNDETVKLDKLASNINVTAEAYPELRSSEIFKELQASVRDTEEHLQAARRLYNSNVTIFNTAIKMFPSSIVANSRGCTEHNFFVTDEVKHNDVSMVI